MPLRQNKFSRRSPHRYWSVGGGERRSVNWVTVGATIFVIALIVVGIILLARSCASNEPSGLSIGPVTQGSATPSTTLAAATSTPEDVADGSSEARALDLSQDAVKIVSSERNINRPGIYGDELVYSAGTGSLDKPVLTKLFLFNLKTMEETELTKVTVKNGEIYETYINTDYIVWLDTDQQGTNKLYYIPRHNNSILDGEMLDSEDGEAMGEQSEISMTPSGTAGSSASPSVSPSAAPTPTQAAASGDDMQEERQLKESGYHMPALRLSGDRLIWNEQDSDKTEVLYLVDLINEENVTLPGYTESIEGFESAYSVSAPDIHGSEVIWAAPDRDDPNGRNSVIYDCDLDRLVSEEDYEPEPWKADMYVHDPVTNGRAWAWIDTNHEPLQNLYIKYGDTVTLVTESTLDSTLTNYSLGDDMLVYTKGGSIWVYFYETGVYGRVTAEGETGRQPVTYGRRVVWFTDSVDGKDQLMVVYIP